jgi:decaprenylphospho-beta-D-erythro-pentofuranosid-2-ulose 2-reductase
MTDAVLIVGATSDIGRAIAASFAAAGHPLLLAARDGGRRLQAEARDLGLRYGVEVTLWDLDILDEHRHAELLDALPGLPPVVGCVVGLLGDQVAARHDHELASRIMRTNYLAPALFLARVAERMEARRRGSIIGISSVAGERGRASNYVYGSAKAGFTAFLSGLRNRLHGAGVHVLTVKPGFVATRMTEGMTLPPVLTAEPEEVGSAVYRAWRARRDVIYVRSVWRPAMAAVRLLPERLFKGMRL